MTQEFSAVILIALAVVLLALAWWGWRNRTQRFRHLAGALIRTTPASSSLLDFSGLYVATTVADQPMNRIPVGPLAFRAKAHFSVHPEGVVVRPQGEASVLFDSSGGLKAGKATWTIDRVVEPDGLVMIRWDLGGTGVDSYVRIVDSDAATVIRAINSVGGQTR